MQVLVQKQSLAVIGSGAVGGVVGGLLSRAGHEVCFFDVDSSVVETISRSGIHLQDKNEEISHIIPGGISQDLSKLKYTSIRWVFLAVKAPDLLDLGPRLAETDRPDREYIIGCNGLDIEAMLVNIIDPTRVHRAVLNLAAACESPGRVTLQAIMGPTALGPCRSDGISSAREAALLLENAGIPTEMCYPIAPKVWEKTIHHAMLAPLCAVTGKNMATVISDPKGKALMESLLIESMSVARANGIHLASNFFDEAVAYVMRGGNHFPSLARDLQQGKQLEVEWLSGALLRYAASVSLSMPVTNLIFDLIQIMEQNTASTQSQ